MASTIKIKRSGVAGKQPNTASLSVGELAINYKDQKLYSSNGTAVFEIGASGGGSSSNGFSGILVGANVISADSTTNRLTFVAGSGITLAANPTTDTITISTTSGAAANVVTKAVKDLTQNDTVVTSVSGLVAGGSSGITTGKAIAMAIVFGG